MRILTAAGLYFLCTAALPAATAGKPAGPKNGIKTPGIQIPIESLKSEAQIPVETPGWITVGESVFVPNKSKDAVVRIDAKANKPGEAIPNVKKPCSGMVVAFGSLWIPSCETQTLTRFDTKANKVVATMNTGVADVSIGLAATSDSVWMITDAKTTLSRIDPVQNAVVGELRLPAACNSVSFGEGSLWVTCPGETRLLRINPVTNLVEKRIDVSAGPRSTTFGAGSVWVLCDKEGKVERIDPKTNKVIKTIDLGVPNAGGNLAFGDGFVWASQAGFPLTRIDPQSEKEHVAQQFWGEGGGSVSATAGAIWLSNVSKGSVWRLDPKRVIATLPE